MDNVTAALKSIGARQSRAADSSVSPRAYERNAEHADLAKAYERGLEEPSNLRPQQQREVLRSQIHDATPSVSGLATADRLTPRGDA